MASRSTIRSPNDAIALGIGMVHQHFMLVPVMTVAENIILGSEVTRAGGIFLDLKRAAAPQIKQLSEQYGISTSIRTPTSRTCRWGCSQRAEIVKALYRQADVLILDEPTAVLTPQEVEGLFRTVNSLRQQGKSIIFITHKLKEVLDDRRPHHGAARRPRGRARLRRRRPTTTSLRP